MSNLLGDLWTDGEPNWAAACKLADVRLGTFTAKLRHAPAARWAHLTAFGKTPAEAAQTALAARDALLRRE